MIIEPRRNVEAEMFEKWRKEQMERKPIDFWG